MPSQESYHSVNGIILDLTELDEAECHLRYILQGVFYFRKKVSRKKSVKRSSLISPFSRFIGPNGLIRSAGRIKGSVEIDFNTKHSLVLDAPPVYKAVSYAYLRKAL